jgi:hypothetical protein
LDAFLTGDAVTGQGVTHRHEDSLMIASRGHGANTINTSRKAADNSGTKSAIAVSSIVESLEEDESGWVRRLLGSDVITQRLDGDVAVTNDIAALKLLRCRVVRVIRVGERSSDEVEDSDVNVEIGVGRKVLAGGRAQDDCGNHVLGRWDISHD